MNGLIEKSNLIHDKQMLLTKHDLLKYNLSPDSAIYELVTRVLWKKA